jgi:drug/metabolite transporter (DMT)-like permease
VSQAQASRTLAGIGFMLLAVACFAALDTTSKHLGAQLPLLLVLWWRYLIQSLISTAVLARGRGAAIWRTRRPGLQLLRGLLLALCSLLALASLQVMTVGDFTTMVMISPLVISLAATLLMHEPVGARRWALLLAGFAGALLILRPQPGGQMHWGLLLPVLLIIINTGFQLLTRKLAQTESSITTQLYTGWTGMALASLALPWVWQWPAEPLQWTLLAFTGLAGAIGHYLLILAYARASAPILTPYMYGQIGFAVLGGWVVFGHVPDGMSLLGMVLVASSGVLGVWWTYRDSRLPAT